MRISRKTYLSQDGGTVHACWRTHDRVHLLKEFWVKNLYLLNTKKALEHKSVNNKVHFHAFCLMDNHSHQLLSYEGESDSLSTFMRIAHGGFGLKFNQIKKRQGAVGYDRPKTPLVQDNEFNNIRVHFYIEANPLRAGIVRNVEELKRYVHCSFRFYAWGIKDNLNAMLEIPKWYLKLGKTAKQRQSKYRSLFNKYLKDYLKRFADFVNTKFIGEELWVALRKAELKNTMKLIVKSNAVAPHPPPT